MSDINVKKRTIATTKEVQKRKKEASRGEFGVTCRVIVKEGSCCDI